MSTTALVTGANRGLGWATARALAQGGVTVIIGARDTDAGEVAAKELRADGLDAEWVHLDVEDAGSVRAAASEVADRHGHLDILVNNAGVLPEATSDGGGEIVSVELMRRTYATNVFGAVAVTEAFLPLLRRSEHGRVVNVSSVMGSLREQSDPGSPYAGLGVPAYRSSKAALNSVTIALSTLLADTPIKVTAVCPGWVQTDLAPGNREHAPLTAGEAAQVVVRAATLPDDAPSGTFLDRDGVVAW